MKEYAKEFPTDAPLEVYTPNNSPPLNADGGFANSVYLASQKINGGGA